MRLESWVLEMVLYTFFLLMLREGRLALGRQRTSIFLWGSILWTGIIENAMVILGGYDYFGYANHYHFGGKLIDGYAGYWAWLLFVPLAICLGWFLLSLPAMLISIKQSPTRIGEGRSRPPRRSVCHCMWLSVTSPVPPGLTAYTSPDLPLTT